MEAEDPAVVDDAVDQGGGHLVVPEHVAPSAELEVRSEDDAAGLVAVRAGHEPDALQAAFDHASEELLPAGRVLPHALRDADDLAMPLRVDSDGDQDAHVLHVPAP